MKNLGYRASGRGFTLMETVIAIGVLAVLLTAFLAVFGPAAQGIRRAVSVQDADRLAYALEKELVTLRTGSGDSYTTGFEKAYNWIKESTEEPLLIYQYKGNPESIRDDGTMEPYTDQNGTAGEDFIVQPVVRRRGDPEMEEELRAIEGRVFTAKLTQLVFNGESWVKGEAGDIVDPTPDDGDASSGSGVESYPEAVIAFSAEFYAVPNNSYEYISSRLNVDNLTNPIFVRNLAVRR
ncbi:prepilin-type N-terminal cleavage/methylation domain-containing protein [Haloferula luteola]|uniref:Prepilin-type N-terminal cleavage/methylation domain-containing protein n=1 Tax=Haloferula luteola TaxID=595692 RepID=A0A840V3P3_9BACT|nr:prepilin-type N-terminal cleavage/methylation domain-containing protein [Haloferula luteola]MBB5352602.1 prepilin-type N-terminal cleavage/methylation domain-containing protein [Haloferula luteola]